MFTISLILGLLLIPLSAVAATALISNDDGETDGGDTAVVVVDVPETTVSTTEAPEAETVFVTEPPTATRADLEAACGPEGLELVEREMDGTITDLEQAALDSLRQICAEEGLELDKGCVNDVADKLSDEDAEKMVEAGVDGDADISPEAEALAFEMISCLDADSLVDSMIEEMGDEVDADCMRDLLKDVDPAALATGDLPDGFLDCMDLGG